MNCSKSAQQRTHDDVSAVSFISRRRIIFPTVHDKYNYIATPLFRSATELAGHVEIYKKTLTLTSSVESDMPSLTSLSTVSDSTSISVPSMNSDDCCTSRADCSQDSFTGRKAVRFDPRIWVHEYDRTDADKKALWFTVQDLNTFKFGAMQCIMAYNSRVPNATTGSHSKISRKKQTRSVLFSHPALGIDNDFDDHMDANSIRTGRENDPLITTIAERNRIVQQFREAVAENEIRNILVVDPQEIFLKLYVKGLRHIFPNSTIATARNDEEALRLVNELAAKTKSKNDFDVIIYDEPKSSEDLDSSTSKTLFENINQSIKTQGLNIMVMRQRDATSQSRRFPDTDWRWTKPPPTMNDVLRDAMLKTLLMKRGRIDIAKKLFA